MKNELIKIIISSILLISGFTFDSDIIFIISYIIIGYDIIVSTFKNIRKKKFLDENFLMTIATIGAIIIKELPEAVAVMLFYKVGELFQNYAVTKSRKSVTELMNIKPDYANLYKNKELIKIDPNEVKIGDIILVKPGEKIPLDGIVIKGKSSLNMFALTGEVTPRDISINDEVLSGSINNEGKIEIRVTKEFKQSTVSKILDLVENASAKKAKSEKFITKFAKYYTPIVVLIAILLSIIPPLFFNQPFSFWLYRSLSFLVVSCPCALVISIPLSFFGGIGAASKIGVLIKGSNYLEQLSNIDIVVSDKTGTLTEGIFEVQKLYPNNVTEEELLYYATNTESFSNHPISLSLNKINSKKIDHSKISDVKEISGKGISVKIDNKNVLVGNEQLFKDKKIDIIKNNEIGTVIYVSLDNKFIGSILIADKIKEDSYKAIKLLRKNKIKKIVMLTGDQKDISMNVAKKLKIDEYYFNLLPQDKVKKIEELLKKGKVLFVGDGINDAPSLRIASIGVAMGGVGSNAAIEAADIVIMTDELSKIPEAMIISKKTMKIVKQNIVFAIFVKISVLILVALGIVNMWLAVFADVGVSVIAVLNSLRMLYVKQK